MENKRGTENATLLLVDDEPINIKVFGDFLSEYYHVLMSTSGEQALQLLETGTKPDLILLDVMMPGMDGYQVVKNLKANPETRDIPVVFVTALSGNADEERGLNLGAVDYIYKPCNLSILLARVRIHLELNKTRLWLQDQNAFLEAEIERRQKESQQVQLQLLQSEKLAAIGQLAAGVAHEINNPIGFVNSNLNALKSYMTDLLELMDACQKFGSDSIATESATLVIQRFKQQKDIKFLRQDIPELIDESLEGLGRVRNIISSLKDFSHASDNRWDMANIAEGLDSTLNIVWNELKYHCNVHKDYGDLPEVYCQISLLNQVFMNLLVNAAQAIKGKGDITIRTRQSGEYVCIEIADTGEGIAEENLDHLFEPFFTTKPVGKGTGLGLPISQNIVHAHGGRIEVESREGRGATFRVILPIQPTSVNDKV